MRSRTGDIHDSLADIAGAEPLGYEPAALDGLRRTVECIRRESYFG